MDDDQFLYTLFGDLPRIMDSSEDYVDMFKLIVARYIFKTYKLFFANKFNYLFFIIFYFSLINYLIK